MFVPERYYLLNIDPFVHSQFVENQIKCISNVSLIRFKRIIDQLYHI